MSKPKRPLRVAHLSFSALPRSLGGLEIVVDSLLRAQLDAGCDVRLVTRWKQYRDFRKADFPYGALALPPNPRLSHDPLGPVGPRWPVSAAVRAYQRRYRFDIWHIHSLYPTGWMAYDALAATGVPVTMTAHGVDIETEVSTGYGYRLRHVHDARIRALVQRAKVLTAISDSTRDLYFELGANQNCVHEIPNGVDSSRIQRRRASVEHVRHFLSIPIDSVVILSIGRNEPRKGFQIIPTVLSNLRKMGHDAFWVVVGANVESLHEPARKAGVFERMRFVPPIERSIDAGNKMPPDDLIDIMKTSDIFACPSLMESFGLVVLEAMAAGLPVVANNVPGLRDVVEDSVDGLLCSPNDSDSMAKSISRILQDSRLREELVTAGKSKANAYDWQHVTGKYLALYDEIITGAAA